MVRTTTIKIIATLLLITGVAAFVAPVNAAFNPQINYQGKLLGASGSAVSDGTYHMKFRLYDALSGGTLIAEENRSSQAGSRVSVQSGLFSVMLGSTTDLTTVNFNQTLYLEVQVGGTGSSSWETLSPRKILGAVPAAFEASRLSGIASSSFVRSDEADTISASAAGTLLTVNQTGAGAIVDLQDGGVSALTVIDGGNVGIGTSSPFAKLTIQGGNVYIGGNLTATGTVTFTNTGTSTAAGSFDLAGDLNVDQLFVTGATSTFASGISIGSGCYAVNGVCLSTAASTLLNDLGDVDTAGVSAGNILAFDGTNWVDMSTSSYILSGEIDTSSEVAALLTDETGTGNVVFSTNPLLAGFRSYASSTIGDGTQAGGLTINGGATTTGNAYFTGNINVQSGGSSFAAGASTAINLTNSNVAVGTIGLNGNNDMTFNISNGRSALFGGNVGIGTTSPWAKLSVAGAPGGTSPLFSVSSSTAGFATTTVFHVDANGNVGVGTAAPGTPLEVNGTIRGATFTGWSSGVTRVVLDNGVAGLQFASDRPITWSSGNTPTTGKDTGISRYGIGTLAIGNGTTADFSGTLIAGNIGIGTSSPFAKLTLTGGNAYIGGALTATGTVTFTDTGTSTAAGNFDLAGDLNADQLFVTGATSTFANGINISTGCFAQNGTCLTSAGATALDSLLDVDTTGVAAGNVLAFDGANWVDMSTSSYLTTTELDTISELEAQIGGTNLIINTEIDTSSELIALVGDETGSGALVFANNPLLAGFRSYASSTIGDGTQAGGLTVNGGATTTGNAYFAGNVGIGTASPGSALNVVGKVAINNTALGSNSLDVYSASAGTLAIFQSNGLINDQSMVNAALGASGLTRATGFSTSGNTSEYLRNYIQQSGDGAALWDALVLGTGDAYSRYGINGGQNWSLGLDNSDSDSFKISGSSVLGTNDYLTITSGGNIGIGTTSPFARLTLSGGDTFLGGNLTATGTVTFTGTGTSTAAGNFDLAGDLNADQLFVTGATSSFASGISIASGCYRDASGACLSSAAATLLDSLLDVDTTGVSAGNVLAFDGTAWVDMSTSSYILASEISTSALLAGLLSDETGSGAVVFGTAPSISNGAFSSTTLSGLTAFNTLIGNNATTTNFFATTASSTNFFATAINAGNITSSGTGTFPVLSSGRLDFPSSSGVGFPSIRFNSSDLYSISGNDSSGYVHITANTNSLNINNNGAYTPLSFGIGSSSPYAKLSVTNTGSGPSFIVSDSADPDTTPFVIDASGNVGIGTTTPTDKLDVNGTIRVTQSGTPANYFTLSNASGVATINAAQTAGGSTATLRLVSGTNALDFSQNLSGGTAFGGVSYTDSNRDLGIQAASTGKGIGFFVNGNSAGTAGGASMYIASTGNIGLGTTSPFAKLTVQGGDAFIGGNLTATGTVTITGTGTSTAAGNFDLAGDLNADQLFITGATSTFASGLDIATGCVRVNGTCLANTDVTGNWTGTFDGQEGAYYLANSFSTTSASYFLSQNGGSAFSTTSANYWKTQTSISGFSDVDTAGVAAGNVLAYDGSKWVDMSTSSYLTTTELDTIAELETQLGSINLIVNTEIDTSSELAGILTDETGTGNVVFSTNPLLAGFRSYASSTIGDGTQAGGLTINGGATTTGNAYFGGQVSVPLGAVGTPSLTFNGDTDTGIYSQGSDIISFATNGVLRSRIDNSAMSIYQDVVLNSGLIWGTKWNQYSPDANLYIRDNVNARMQVTYTSGASAAAALTTISSRLTVDGTVTFADTGTSTAAGNFDLAGDLNADQLFVTGATSTFASGIDVTTGCVRVNGTCLGTGSGTVNAGTAGQLPYYAANGTTLTATSSIFIATSGKVGIGTTNPGVNFDVSGSGTVYSRVVSTDGQANLHLYGATFGQLQNSVGDFYITNSSAAGNMIFRTSASELERMRITAAGNIGIGTSSPFAKLTLSGGDAFIGGNLTATGTFAITGTGTSTNAGNEDLAGDLNADQLFITGATSSFASGINIGTGCFAQNGTCLTSAGATALDSLLDVDTTGVAAGNVLAFDGTNWVDMSTSSYLTSTELDTISELETQIGGTNLIINTEIDTSSELIALVGDETGSGALVFANNPLLTGFRSYASSTIGDGTQAGGLTVNGGATTTGNAYFAGNVGIGTQSPQAKLHAAGQTGNTIMLDYLNGGDNYFDSAGATHFRTTSGYSERMTILASGNIGIGTTSPWGKLSVTNTGTDPSFIVSDSADPDTTPFVIDASGNVGMGTTTIPTGAKLIVDRAGYSATQSIARFVESTTNNRVDILAGGSIRHVYNEINPRYMLSSNGTIDFGLPSASGALALGSGDSSNQGMAYIQSPNSGVLNFFIATTSSPSVSMYGTSVGIGTSSPFARLTISGGDAFIGGALTATGTVTFTNTGTSTAAGNFDLAGDLNADQLFITGATSSFASGINIGTGCFAQNGTCLTSAGATALDSLLDVDTTGVAAGNVLAYDGANWVDMSTSSYLTTTELDTVSELETQVGSINLIVSTEIDTYAELNAIVADVTLTHNGLIDTSSELKTIVTDETGGTGSLAFINTSGLSAGQVLIYNGTDWVGMSTSSYIVSGEIDTSSELAGILGDESGSGSAVFGDFAGIAAGNIMGWDGTNWVDMSTSSYLTTTELDTIGELETQVGAINLIVNTEIDTSSELAGILTDETGSGLAVFATNPLLTGFRSYASSTIGGGSTSTGLTINGGATTTGVAYFGNTVGIGVANPSTLLHISNSTAEGKNLFHIQNPSTSPSATTGLSFGQFDTSGFTYSALYNVRSPTLEVRMDASPQSDFVIRTTTFAGDEPEERLRVDTDGYVGIGTSSPLAKLTVSGGNAYIGGALTATGTVTFTDTGTSTAAGSFDLAGDLNADQLFVTGATSTFASGLSITTGCFAINGVCLSTSGLIDALTDVDTSGVAAGNVLAYDGANWVDMSTSSYLTTTELDTIGELETQVGAVNILLATELANSSNLAGLLSDESGSGTVIFGSVGSVAAGNVLAWDGANWVNMSTSSYIVSTEIDTSSELSGILTDETGSGLAVFATNPLLTGFRSYASSTIGGGTSLTGLTVNGGATTTGNAVFGGDINAGMGADTTRIVGIGTDGSFTSGDTAIFRIGDSANQISTPYGGATTYQMFHGHIFRNQLGEIARIGTSNASLNSYFNGSVGIGTTSPYSMLSVAGTTTAMVFQATSTTATSTFAGGLEAGLLHITSSGTSTFENGINLDDGCYAVDGVCLGGGSTIGTAVSGGTPGSVLFVDAAGNLGQDNANFFFDNTNDRFGIGSSTPFARLSIMAPSSGTNPIMLIGSSTLANALFTITSGGNVGIGTSSPFATLSVNGAIAAGTTTATSTFAGSFVIDGGKFSHNYALGETSITNLNLGPVRFDDDAGWLSWIDLPITTASATGTPMAFTAQIDSMDILTVYAEASGSASGTAKNLRVVVGSSTQTVLSSTNIPLTSLIVANGILCVDDGGGSNCDDAARTAGQIYAESGTVTAIDVAENYPTTDPGLMPGMIAVLDTQVGTICTNVETENGPAVCAGHGTGTIPLVSRANRSDTMPVLGIISTEPGLLLGGFGADEYFEYQKVPVTLSGRIPMQVNGEGGTIMPGDRISLSSVSGLGAKATTSGETFAIALSPATFTATSGTSTILVFVENRDHRFANQFFIGADGKVGIGTTTPGYELSVQGTVAANAFVNYSSKEVKTDIEYLDDERTGTMLSQLRGMKIAEYRYEYEDVDAPLRIGLIAEDAPMEILSVSSTTKTGAIVGVDLYKLSVMTLAGVQELAERIETIETLLGMGSSTASTTAQGGIAGFFERMGIMFQNGLTAIANLTAGTLTVGSSEKPSGITMFDEANGDAYCIKVQNGETVTLLGECTPPEETGEVSLDTEPPVIVVNGDNPLTLTIGETYLDPGIVVTDNATASPRVELLLNGAATSTLAIDTSVVGTHTITYRALDAAGNASVRTRLVIVASEEEEIVDDTGTTTVSTTSPTIDDDASEAPEPSPESAPEPLTDEVTEPADEPEPTPEPTETP